MSVTDYAFGDSRSYFDKPFVLSLSKNERLWLRPHKKETACTPSSCLCGKPSSAPRALLPKREENPILVA